MVLLRFGVIAETKFHSTVRVTTPRVTSDTDGSRRRTPYRDIRIKFS